MSGGPHPQCEAWITVLGIRRRCLLSDDHGGYHHYDGGYKQPIVYWDEPRWHTMIFTGVAA